ncbi:MAG: hypothetical protein ACI4UY_03475, partial [Kiritimatiellia bacterium]
ELLRRRGGFDWAFRVEPDSWRSAWKGGVLTGVTVFARGEVRPDVGTLYFPVPLTNGVSLLPEARWGMLPHAEEGSVFSHAVTTNGSLLLDWRNALVGRDPNSPTNLQMELFADGGFVWRTDGGSTSYLPVLPFDYDGDGLENAVDPEPLVPNPVDAHGTPPEWYRVVCSNVFEAAGDRTQQVVSLPNGEAVAFRADANARAYYFVDVVAASGPAPVSFAADRASRLGSPVLVARAGETNRVPLLVGIAYAVTSTVPVAVSAAAPGGFAEIEADGPCAYTVRWPQGDEAKLTVVRVEIRSTVDPPDPSARSINRHTYGVCERIELLQFPGSPKVAWEPVGGGTLDSESFYSCPLSGCRNPLRASCAGISYTPQIEVVEPDGVKAELLYGTTRESVITYGVPRGKAGGIGMWLRLSVKPFHVSFSRIAVQEVVSFTYDASGYFSNPYFNGVFAHSGGIVGAGAGIWHDIDEDNYFSDDEAAYNAVVPWLTQKGIPTNDPACSWTSGYVYMDNPFGWNKKGTSGDETVYKRFAEDVQDEIMIDAVGTVGVRKLFNQVTRTTNDVIHVNGRRIQ